jgi:putative zinc finger protein
MVVSCEEVWREISNYLEEDMDPGLRSAMEEHFRSCQHCTAVIEGTRNVLRLYGDDRMFELPSGFSRRMERWLTRNVVVSRGTWPGWLIAAVAAVLVASGLTLARSLTPDRPLKSEQAQAGHGIPPDMVVVVTEGAKLFHVPGCEVIHNKDRQRTLTAKEATREGYVPCLRCMRKYLNVAGARRAVENAENDGEREEEIRTEGD